MKSRIPAVLIVCVLSVALALAQTSTNTTTTVPTKNTSSPVIFGQGTPNFVPMFLGPNSIGNSVVFQTPDGSIGIGTTTPNAALNVEENGTNLFVIRGTTRRTSGFASGVLGETSSPDGLGVLGVNNTSGNGVAVRGDVSSGAAVAVFGLNLNRDTNSGGGGVSGFINATAGFNTAIRGTALGTTGPSVAVFGEQFSSEGQAGLFINRAGGEIIRGAVRQNPDIAVFRVDGSGRVFADGGFQPNGADFAESVRVTGNRNKYAPGDLLVIDQTENRRLALAQGPYSTLVAGIFSTKPGMLGSTHKIDEQARADEVPLAVVGIVPCKVTAENGPITAGDLLVTSSTPGHAMKGTDRGRMLGAVVGKALEPLRQGTGIIQVLVTLQ